MKILYIITKSTVGGAQTHISQLTSSLLDDGHQAGVISQPGGWMQEDIEEKNGRFYPNEHLQNCYSPITLLKAIESTQQAIENFDPDLISCHSSFAGLVGRVAAKKYDFPTLFTAHGWGFSQGTPAFRRSIIKISEKLASRWTDKIICVSNYDKQLAVDNNITQKEKLTTIHNGTEIPEIDWGQYLIEDKIRIVFTGRLSKQKAPLLLVKALSELPEKLQDKWELIILGEGPKKEEIKKYIQKNNIKDQVNLKGNVTREQVFKQMKQSHIFTLITNWEGFPRSILEAMSCGLPVVATEVAGIPESVNEDCGILVEKDNKKDVTQAFRNLITNPDLIEEKGKNARKRCKSEFSIEKTTKETKEVYRELINSSN